MKQFVLLFIFFGVMLTTSVYAQEIKVTGVVTSSDDGLPLPGVSVIKKGTTNGTITDGNGMYSLSVSDSSVLVFSFIGMKNQDVKVNGQSSLNVVMELDFYGLEEIIAIGYGSIKKSDVTGSVVAVDIETMTSKNVTNISEGLQGMASGVQVQRSSGAPGASANVIIRGVATINNSTAPLYVVDGIMVGTDANFLNPNDIEGIEVLKDASATAIYGSRGANGVIMITTKKGTKGATTLNAKVDFGLQTPGTKMDVADMAGFTKVANQMAVNDGKKPNPDWADPSQLDFIDWQDEMSRSSLRKQYYLSATGGSEKLQSSYSVGYLKDEGVIRATSFDRLTARTNLNYDINSFIKTGMNIAYTREEGHGGGNLYNYAKLLPTMDHDAGEGLMHVPVQYPDGTWGTYQPDPTGTYINKNQDNPVAQAETAEGPWFNDRVLGNAFMEISLFEGLTFKSINGLNYFGTGGHSYSERHNRTTDPKLLDGFSLRSKTYMEYSTENFFTYNKYFGAHNINAMVGYSAVKSYGQEVKAGAQDFPASHVRNVGLTQDPTTIWGDGWLGREGRQESYFTRVNYTLLDRYILTGTVRRDGSSNFGGSNKYGTFPSVSGAWKIDKETFFANVPYVSSLKMRLGWGQTGNAGNSTNKYLGQVTSERIRYYFYNYSNPTTHDIASGLVQVDEIDENLKWETNEQANIGFDMGLLENSITFSIDYFQRDSKDLLLYKRVRPSTGYKTVYTNAGQIRNKGLEFSAGYKKVMGDFNVSLQVNGSHVKSEAISIGDDIFYNNGIEAGVNWENYSVTREGGPVGAFFGYKTDGIFQTPEEIEALNANAPDGVYQAGAAPGDYKYVDINGDGLINSDDRDVIGNGYADFIYGINLGMGWKQFDFSLNANGVMGQDILSYAYMNLTHGVNAGGGGARNVLQEYADNFWDGPGSSNTYTRPTHLDPNDNKQVSDAYIVSGDYFKIQNIQIGYTFDRKLIEPIKLSTARLYVSMSNVATISAYKKIGDPEIGNSDPRQTGFDNGRYPFPRVYTVGLSVAF